MPGVGDVPFTAEVVWIRRGETGVRFTDVPGKRAQLLREALVDEERRILAERCHPVPTAWSSSYVEVASDDELAKQTRRQKII